MALGSGAKESVNKPPDFSDRPSAAPSMKQAAGWRNVHLQAPALPGPSLCVLPEPSTPFPRPGRQPLRRQGRSPQLGKSAPQARPALELCP